MSLLRWDDVTLRRGFHFHGGPWGDVDGDSKSAIAWDMIIVDDTDVKSPHQVHIQIVPHTGPAPSYHTTPPSYPNSHSKHRPAPTVVHPTKRFWTAFALALLTYVALCTLARTIVHMATHHHRHHYGDDGAAGAPRADDGRILASIGHLNWTAYHPHPHWAPTFASSAETSFTLPVAADGLYLIARGAYQHGRVEVTQAADGQRGGADDVQVDVRVAYHHPQALARATVCRLRKNGNTHGVGIFTPTSTPGWSDMHDRLYVEVVITFPGPPNDRAPVRIPDLTVHTGNFAHAMCDLWESIWFEHIHLETSNAPIHAGSVTLTRGSFVSSNGAIVGHFNTSDAVSLRTSNARIEVTASLYAADRNTTQLDMHTSNGQITASISLATRSGSGGHFRVGAQTSNAGVRLHYDDAPSGVHLVSDAQTSNGPAAVSMHPTFEGTYAVSTSNARAVVRDGRPEDPTGRGRRRVVEQRGGRGTVTGRVYWAGGDGRRGVDGASTTVHTSNAPASLDL